VDSDAAPPPTASPTAGDATAPAPNAGELARQAAALAARRDFEAAVTSFSKAIDLVPGESDYYLGRANAYWAGGHADLALPDFDRAIELKPDSFDAYLRRAELKFAKNDADAALLDLQAVDRLVAPQADVRFTLGQLYASHDRPSDATSQYTLWIDNHADDARMGIAHMQRCWSRSLSNRDLPDALRDCNTVMGIVNKSDPKYAGLFVERALVRLRLGDYDKAIRDCGDALRLNPKDSTALFIRGIAEARKNESAQSDADLAAADQLTPKMAERFARFGIAP
jgi:tetratricopeptide (TPR) repeat protein